MVEYMKATEFNLSKEIMFNIDTGITSFKDTRLILFDANALGLLKYKIVQKMGIDDSRTLFIQLGYQHGFSDFMQMKLNYSFDTEMDLLASGPVIHTWEGIVKATPKEIRYNRSTGEFYFTGIWKNSYEAEQHLQFNKISIEPVCWTLSGYASGWCTAFFGKPILTVEPLCIGKGDSHCEWMLKPVAEWGEDAKPYISALEEFWKEV